MRFLFPFRVVVCLFLLVVSCTEKKGETVKEEVMPSDSLISPEKMIHILADIHVIEAGLVVERNDRVDSKVAAAMYYEGIFKKYHISRNRYDANLKHYSQSPSELSKMYDKVIREIEIREKSFPLKK
ncbi:MAG: DUF4296 domain-containing protein [Bacteroidota bacterium]